MSFFCTNLRDAVQTKQKIRLVSATDWKRAALTATDDVKG